MAETEPAGSSSHVVINVDEATAEDDGEAAANNMSCAVCLEPMEWVAVSPCGHGEVCVRCAARIRFVHKDRRCCICRSHCATVVVTKAPAAFGGQGLVVVGVDYWYHRCMGAYFDDLSQYEEMSKVCAAAASRRSWSLEESPGGAGAAGANQQPAAAASVNVVELERPLSPRIRQLLLGVAGVFILGAPLLYMIPT